jgi:hypothetical protein
MCDEAAQPQRMHRYAVHPRAAGAAGIRGGCVRYIAEIGIPAGLGDQ